MIVNVQIGRYGLLPQIPTVYIDSVCRVEKTLLGRTNGCRNRQEWFVIPQIRIFILSVKGNYTCPVVLAQVASSV
jgi:hypothetical protein